MSEARDTYEKAVEAATAKGCIVVAPGPRELFVDIDSAEDLDVFHLHLARLKESEVCTFILRPSPSGAAGRFHAVVTLERDVRSEDERMLLQAVLGSDRMRELLGWIRATRGDGTPTLFFEKAEVIQ